MPGDGEKLIHEDPGGSTSKTKTESDLAASQLKRALDKKSNLKGKPKSKSHVSSALSSKNREAGSKRIFSKALEKKSSSTLMWKFQCEKPSSISLNAKDTDGDGQFRKRTRRKVKKKLKINVELDEPSRLQRRTRYLMIKMKLEQNLIDAYSGEGWKGQSREKIRPVRELQRANKQILKCKLGLRDAIRQLNLLSSVGCIEENVIAPDGSVYHEHIFCAKCKLREAFPDNDIILCDGTCNCAFHQKCLDPPLETENIPPEDEGWFCKFCDCKMEILEAMNAHLGTHFSVESNWQDIFREEAAFPDGGSGLLNSEELWPSDDSEDDDYNPEGRENSCGTSQEGDNDNASEDTSRSTSLSWSLDAEISGSGWLEEGVNSKNHLVDRNVDFDDPADGEIIPGSRRRSAVDYKKLYDEMFGKDAPAYEQVSEDEDWGPAKRRRKEKESDAASTLMTLYESEKNCANVEVIEVDKKPPSGRQNRRPLFRIPTDAVEKLRQVFADNELPSKAIKENLSKELGLDFEKVNKWFKNARYMSLKSRKVILEFSDDISLEKQLKLLKGKTKEKKKRVNFMVACSQKVEYEMERLCRAKSRLENMRQKLLRFNINRGNKSKKRFEQSIVYVPIAELRERG